MPLIVKDRVRETTTTTGTGTLTLIAPVTGFQSFSVIGNGNTTYYSIVDVATGAWEVGIGTYTSSGTTLSRDIVLESSTGGAKISFSSGTKDVFCTYPAERSVSQADVGTDPNEIPLNQYLGSMAYQDRAGVNISGGVATLSTATVTSIQNDTAISNVEPSLMLNFAAVEALDPRITYTRASTATYYNGVTTAVAEQNLFINSQNSTTGWTNFNNYLTVTTSYETAPDGTTTGMRLQNSSGNVGYFYQNVGSNSLVSGSTYTISVWVKSNTGSTQTALFMIPDTSITNSISVTTSWTRVTWTPTLVSTNSFAGVILNPATATDISVWGFQLEQRSAVSAYTPTTTQPITNYIPVLLTAASGVPRFDHNPISGDSLGFLVEQQSTNLVTYSSEFDNAAWGKANVTVVANQIIAPDGTLTADLFYPTTSGSFRDVGRANTASSAIYTVSVYAKYSGIQFAYFRNFAGSNLGAHFDLLNGVVGTVQAGFTASIQNVGNGIYRCTMTSTAAVTNPAVYFGVSDANNSSSVTASGTNGIYIWGAQLEATAFSTSYIATVASQVTRAADSASMTGTNFSSWFNNAEGTLYGELAKTSASGRLFEISDGTSTNRTLLYGSTNLLFDVRVNGVDQASITLGAVTTGVFTKVNATYKVNDFIGSKDGTLSSADTLGVVNPNLTQMFIGSGTGGSGFLNGTIKKFAYYPRRLSNEELQEMTS